MNVPRNIRRHRATSDDLFETAERLEDQGKFREAFSYLLAAARRGHLWSQLNVGNFYSEGLGVRRNRPEAAKWYKHAYRKGDPVGARNLAIDLLNSGNIRSAILWFKKGVQGRDGGSCIQLAELYLERRETVKALKLLKRVASLDIDEASDEDREEATTLIRKHSSGRNTGQRSHRK
jgi:TPR repeat protein